ncbi:MAG: YraN family protein [Cyclobacteriaceae bacterium]|nr:YraN family protein [Cyclobacteriaceae bacterium]
MSKSKHSGQLGEQLAADYLKQNGWNILAMNYRHKRAEIDIVASNENILLFVEVKTRSNMSFGQPEDFVDSRKAERIISAADHFIREIDWRARIRFDIISIDNTAHGKLTHFEDAFY